MTTTDIRDLIAAERRDLATVFAELSPEQWDAPSLCEGWRVRELVAHLTMPFRYSVPRFLLEVAKDRGNFNRMADRRARHDARLMSPSDLVAAVADNVTHPWKPPGGGLEGALCHDVIHGLDVTEALDLGRSVPLDRLRVVLDAVAPQHRKAFGVDLSGAELQATDLDWRHGEGAPVTGRAQDLLLLVCGRPVRQGSLTGEPVERLARVRQSSPSGP